MKKLLFLILCLTFLSGCSNCNPETIHVEVGQSSFDGEVITFYDQQVRHGNVLTSSYLYYTVGSSNSQNDGTLLSKDGNFKMFVDFNGKQEVTDVSGNVIKPSDRIQYEDHDINIYTLNTNETYYELSKGLNDYSFIFYAEPCSEIISLFLDIETVKAEIERWTKLGDTQDYVRYEDFIYFFEIEKNKREVGELIRHWGFAKVELDDGRWIVHLMGDESEYFLLEADQVEFFKKMIEN